MNATVVVHACAGLLLVILDLRGILRRELTLYDWFGFRQRRRSLEGPPAVLFSVWMIICGLVFASMPFWYGVPHQ
jgi:hypothetical protein